MSKLPEGVPVYIREYDDGYVAVDNRIPLSREANGTAMTYADRLERDKAIARAVAKEMFNKGFFAHADVTMAKSLSEILVFDPNKIIDDYLQSEEFKELTK